MSRRFVCFYCSVDAAVAASLPCTAELEVERFVVGDSSFQIHAIYLGYSILVVVDGTNDPFFAIAHGFNLIGWFELIADKGGEGFSHDIELPFVCSVVVIERGTDASRTFFFQIGGKDTADRSTAGQLYVQILIEILRSAESFAV